MMIDESGNIGFELCELSHTGSIYYVDITGLNQVAIRNLLAKEDCVLNISYKTLKGSVPSSNTKPIQVIGTGELVGDGEKTGLYIDLGSDDKKHINRRKLVSMFKYFVVHYYDAPSPFMLTVYNCPSTLVWASGGENIGTFAESDSRGDCGIMEMKGDRLSVSLKFSEAIAEGETVKTVILGIR